MARVTGSVEGRSQGHLRVVSGGVGPAEDDAALVVAVRAMAPGAAGRLWDRYATLVRRILRRTLGPIDVEDGVQDAFLRLFKDLGTLRDPSSLRSFLIGITLHVANSELRRRRARRWLFLSDDGVLTDPAAFATDDWHEPRAAVLHLYEVLDRVSSECRAVFVLRFVEGLELVELAAVLGCSLATAKRRVADASHRICLLTAGDPILAPYLEPRR